MGTVYRGRHIDTDEKHAIKVLAPKFADDEHFRGRFESEIKALLKLDHDNIVGLLSYGQDDGQLFFAMELVQGQSLFQLQKAGHQFDWRQVLMIARECANGLRHAHDRGIIHRDLKPGNLMMTDSVDGNPPQVKLTDFGIAKRFGSSQNTGTNILGTMDFMSPEQAKGEPVTARSDLYSLGAVLFALLTGRPPFSNNSVEESLRNLTNVPAPSVTVKNPTVPKPIDELISKLMAKKPEERIPTALVLLNKIGDIENELRDDASARTSHGEGNSQNTEAPRPQGAPTIVEGLQNKNRIPETLGLVHGPTSEHKDGELKLAPLEDTKSRDTKDYFNQVTQSQRRQHSAPDGPRERRSIGLIPLVLALFGVIGLGIYGWSLATATPTAEQLFAEIEQSSDTPNKVVDEISLFLKNYPDDPRADSLTDLKSVGLAIRDYQSLKNTLTVRARSPRGLTDVEQTFLELANLAKEDAKLAGEKMAAFALVNESIALDDQDMKCVHAAKGYSLKLKHEQRTKAQSQLSRIRSAVFNAREMDAPQEALEVYRSLLKLYADTDFSALKNPYQGAEALALVKEKISELENQIRVEALEAEKNKAEEDDDLPKPDSPAEVEPLEKVSDESDTAGETET